LPFLSNNCSFIPVCDSLWSWFSLKNSLHILASIYHFVYHTFDFPLSLTWSVFFYFLYSFIIFARFTSIIVCSLSCDLCYLVISFLCVYGILSFFVAFLHDCNFNIKIMKYNLILFYNTILNIYDS
jgi:hypothetical protein